GRMLPGFEPDQFIAEVRELVGPEPEINVLQVGPRLPEPQLDGFFGLLCDVLRGLEPEGVAVPVMMTGATDQRHFGQLGIRGYGRAAVAGGRTPAVRGGDGALTRDSDFKRVVRARMRRTGESYMAARARLTQGFRPRQPSPPSPPISTGGRGMYPFERFTER